MDVMYVQERSEEGDGATVSHRVFRGFGHGDVFQAFAKSEILKSCISDISLCECDDIYLSMVENSANENMSEDFSVEEIKYEFISEDESQPPIAISEELTNTCSLEELSSTPLKLDKNECEEVDGEELSMRKSSRAFEKKRSLTEIQSETINSYEFSCETETSQMNTVHSPLLFTPVKGEITYGAGYLTQNSLSSIYSIDRVGSASKTHDQLFTTPPSKSVKKLSLALTPTNYLPVGNEVKVSYAPFVNINRRGELERLAFEIQQKDNFPHPSSPSSIGEKNISPQKLFFDQKCVNALPGLPTQTEDSDALALSCGLETSQNCELQSHVESDTRSYAEGGRITTSKSSNSSPSNSSLTTEAKKDGRLGVSLGPQKCSRVQLKTRRKHRLRTLLSRARHALAGLPPPTSFTIPQLTVSEMLEKIYKSKFVVSGRNAPSKSHEENSTSINDSITSLFHPSATEQEIMKMSWPEVLDCVHLGVCYNLGCSSETLEDVCQQVREKFVGNETASSCSIWSLPKMLEDSNHRRSNISLASSVSREGYITRRRRAFSIASLTTAVPSVISKTRQILVNGLVKKQEERKKLPAKHKRELDGCGAIRKEDAKRSLIKKCIGEKGRSAKKNSSIRRSLSFEEFSGNHGQSSSKQLSSSQQAVSSSSLVNSTRRVLSFDSGDKASSKSALIPKDRIAMSSSPSLPGSSESLFSSDSQDYKRNRPLCSAITLVRELSEVHKKKLLWAVAQALRSRGLGTEHDKFKMCAIPLFRHCREEFLNGTANMKRESFGSSDGSDSLCPSVGSTDSQKESTSDKMLAIALGLVDRIMKEVGVATVIKERAA